MIRESTPVRLESPLPEAVPAGSAITLFCSGTACRAEAFEFVVGDERHSAAAVGMPRFDIPCRRSGFWGVVPVRAPTESGSLEIRAAIRWPDRQLSYATLGRVPVGEPLPDRSSSSRDDELVAICMGTYEPDPDMLRAQIDSIRSQTDTRWVCVISDDHSSEERFAALRSIVGSDERFSVSRAGQRTGFYRNFERSLQLAPPSAGLLAFCDQDDVWHREKLHTLRASLGSAMLAYSDMRLVDEAGHTLRETLWQGRRNNSSNLASMLMANTVTGAAALFRREVAERALPFPDSPGLEFHDHWIALIALAIGEIAYIDRPLYDYVQHRSAVVGNVAGPVPSFPGRKRLRVPRMHDWRAAYFLGYVPGEIRARTLLLRCTDQLTPSKRRALERYLGAGSTASGLAWLLFRPARMLAGRTETLGGEWQIALGIVWRHLAIAVARLPGWPERWTLDTRFPDPARFEHKRLRRWRERI